MTGTPTSDPDRSSGGGTADRSHLLLVGAGPGLGMAVARRFAVGGYRVTIAGRSFALPASSEVTRMRAEHEIAGDASNHPSGRLGDSQMRGALVRNKVGETSRDRADCRSAEQPDHPNREGAEVSLENEKHIGKTYQVNIQPIHA
jgi:hypothetical protein